MKRQDSNDDSERLVEQVQTVLDGRDVTVSAGSKVDVGVIVGGDDSEKEVLSKDEADEVIDVLESGLDDEYEVYWVSERDIFGSHHGQTRASKGYVKVWSESDDFTTGESDDVPWRDPDVGERWHLKRDSDSYTVVWCVTYPDRRSDDYYFSRDDAGRRMEWYCEESRDELDWEWDVMPDGFHAEAEGEDGELEMVICSPIQVFHEGEGWPPE